MQKIPGSYVHLIMPEEMIARLDRVATRLNLSRSAALRNTLDVGLTVFEDFEKIGIIRFAEIVGKTKKALSRDIGQQSLFEAK